MGKRSTLIRLFIAIAILFSGLNTTAFSENPPLVQGKQQEQEKNKIINIKSADIKHNILVLKHDSYGSIPFKKRIYNSPPRLVFDLKNAKLKTGKKTFKSEKSEITEVRVGQFDPETVRIVIEADQISSLEKIKVENLGQSIYFHLVIQNVVINSHKLDDGDLYIKANGQINFRKILLGNPERLVLDLIGAQLRNSGLKKEYTFGEEKIKIAQFEKSIVRVVFSGPGAHKREIKTSADKDQLLVETLVNGQKKRRDKPKGFENIINQLDLITNKDDETAFIIKSSSEITYKSIKLHDPERIVLDIFDTVYEKSLEANQFPETIQVKDVRFGIATVGKPVTRIVFDLKRKDFKEKFRLSSDKKELVVRITGKDDGKTESGIPKAYKSVGRKVVLDAGHGGYDPGTAHGNRNEKDITLAISQKVKKYLKEAGIKAYMTRTDDRFVSLAERVEVSNSIKPRIFVSIHVNALATNTKMDGLQTYHYSKAGHKLGSFLHKRLLKDVGMPDRRIRKARFWVCKHTHAPSVLLELGFLTNPPERKKLSSDAYQTKLAKAVATGIIEYLEKN